MIVEEAHLFASLFLFCILAAGNGVFLLKTAIADGACKPALTCKGLKHNLFAGEKEQSITPINVEPTSHTLCYPEIHYPLDFAHHTGRHCGRQHGCFVPLAVNHRYSFSFRAYLAVIFTTCRGCVHPFYL